MESTLIFHLGQSVDNKLFQRCPFTDEQISHMSPSIESNSNAVETGVVSVSIPTTPPISHSASTEFEIASVTSISSESFSNVEPVASSSTGLIFSDMLSYKDLEKEYLSEDWDKYFESLLPARPPQPSTSKRKSSTTQAKVELPESKKVTTTTTSRTDLLQEEIDAAAYVLVKGTGLEGQDLYRCSFANCEEKR